MNTCSEQIVHYMHAYLDGDITPEDEQKLMKHIKDCPACDELMESMSDITLMLENVNPVPAPEGFVSNVMKRLPKEKSQRGIQRWLRTHPLIAAAALFFVLMSVSVFADFGNTQQFSVTKQPNLIIEGQTVLVPEGETVIGDVIVENGELRVEGEVNGNIIVINGSKYMASTAIVTGNIEEIDKAFDWLWYKMKSVIKSVLPSSDLKEEE